MSKPTSKHIFLFPFKWEVKTESPDAGASLFERTNLESFRSLLDLKYWEEFKFKIKEPLSTELNPYNEYSYFYDHVRPALNLAHNIESCQYNYKVPKTDKALYKITIQGEKKIELALEIDDIFLNFYQSGVAVFGFILTNKETLDFNNVLKINEYGRRIYPQFLGSASINESGEKIDLTSATKEAFLAEKIELSGLHEKIIEETFSHYDSYSTLAKEPFRLPAHIAELVGARFKTTAYENLNVGEIKITPIIDDRMFVMSYLFENSLIDTMQQYDDKNNEYSFAKSDEWFRYVFIDDSRANCTSRVMKKTLLTDCTYDRWIAKSNPESAISGHLFGMSRYSFVILAADEWFTRNILYLHYSNMYFQMVLLSLVQRASIISYAGEATRLVDKIKSDEHLTSKEIKDINSLAQSFLVFKNQIYFREITAQDQGIDIYKKIHQQMNIEAEVEALEAEIEDLISFVNMESESRKSKEAQNLTWIATLFLPISFIVTIISFDVFDKTKSPFAYSIKNSVWEWVILSVILGIISGLTMLYFMNFKRINNSIKKKISKSR